MHLQIMILKKKKSYFKEELAKNLKKVKKLWTVLKSFGQVRTKQVNQELLLRKMIQFNLKHLEAQIFSKGSTLKNLQRHPTNLQSKQPKTITPRVHATNLMTLNCQMYLKSLSKRF